MINLVSNEYKLTLSLDLKSNYLPIIAEDLGVITKDVELLRDNYELPGMKILQFAFDGNENNPYLPKNIEKENWVVYTGTHDNATTTSWWESLDINIKNHIKDNYKYSNDPSWNLSSNIQRIALRS